MRSIICAALLTLTATTAGPAEADLSANFFMPFCREYVRGGGIPTNHLSPAGP
jgi:hypothetical protein